MGIGPASWRSQVTLIAKGLDAPTGNWPWQVGSLMPQQPKPVLKPGPRRSYRSRFGVSHEAADGRGLGP